MPRPIVVGRRGHTPVLAKRLSTSLGVNLDKVLPGLLLLQAASVVASKTTVMVNLPVHVTR